MTLIKSISGIRGTIGGRAGDSLSPADIVKYTSAYGEWIKMNSKKKSIKVIIGRDARTSGHIVNKIVSGSLVALGINVVDIGLSTTPTVEIAVSELEADGGIIISASHNPKQWNALKLLNSSGEFISAEDGNEILKLADNEDFNYADVDDLGEIIEDNSLNNLHINKITDLKLVDKDAIRKAKFKVIIDCVNSVGGLIIPDLLAALGIEEIVKLYCDPTGDFPHNPEPLPENLSEISEAITRHKADVGFAVDPDVDRLAIVSEDGSMFGEEYTLVSVAAYVLKNRNGNSVSNLSSTRALKDITEKYGGTCYASAVGEVNVIAEMKRCNAVIGGEGNGGVIYPELHYGRDALVGIALFLSLLAISGKKCSELRAGYPGYFISKKKINLNPEMKIDEIFESLKNEYADYQIYNIDGLKIEFEKEWVHIRKSNTEPIIRIYSESQTRESADKLSEKIIRYIEKKIEDL
jgi:phosphomannomutase